MIPTIRLECANCGYTTDLPENPSVKRVQGMALAFYKVNDRPLIITVEHAFKYFLGSKLYLWKQRTEDAAHEIAAEKKPQTLSVPALSESKLKDLSWSLNIKDRESMGVTDERVHLEI